MKKRVYPKDVNQKINNFYSLVTIVVMSAVIVIYSKYILPKEKEKKETQLLSCQEESKVSYIVNEKELLQEGLKLFNRGDYLIDGGTILRDDSKLNEKDIITFINKLFENRIDVVSIKNNSKFLRVKYELIESKKQENEHTLLLSLRVAKDEILKAKTKINLNNLDEAQKKIDCILGVFYANTKR